MLNDSFAPSHSGQQQEHASGWTDERTERLKNLWSDGHSASQIATILGGGVTRNGVLGKAHRLQLVTRNDRPRLTSEEAHRRRLERKRKYRVKAKATRVPKAPRLNVKAKAPESAPEPIEFTAGTWEPLAGSSPVPMVDLETGMCRWQIGDARPYLFCGCEAASGPYCPEHTARSVGTGSISERTAIANAMKINKREAFVEKSA